MWEHKRMNKSNTTDIKDVYPTIIVYDKRCEVDASSFNLHS